MVQAESPEKVLLDIHPKGALSIKSHTLFPTTYAVFYET